MIWSDAAKPTLVFRSWFAVLDPVFFLEFIIQEDQLQMRGVRNFDDLAAGIDVVGRDQIIQGGPPAREFLGKGDRAVAGPLGLANVNVNAQLRCRGEHRSGDLIPEFRRPGGIDESDPDVGAPRCDYGPKKDGRSRDSWQALGHRILSPAKVCKLHDQERFFHSSMWRCWTRSKNADSVGYRLARLRACWRIAHTMLGPKRPMIGNRRCHRVLAQGTQPKEKFI